MIVNALERLTANGLSIGIELPLDTDWSSAGEQRRLESGRHFGIPDLTHHAELAKLVDQLGYRALWVRDVPVYEPSFGDAAQVFEVFTYLGYLAAATERILLGTAAVVLPIREPVLTMKSAASLDHLSKGRLILGVASGDRPVEYPLFERDFENRGAAFRQQVAMLRQWGGGKLPAEISVLPCPQAPLPLLVAGLAQQTPEWVGQHMDGWLAYPGTPDDHMRRANLWRNIAGDKPYISFIHLDLAEHRDALIQRHRFGMRVGRNGLIEELQAMRDVGVHHIGLHFRRNQRPLKETLQEIAEFVLPHFHT